MSTTDLQQPALANGRPREGSASSSNSKNALSCVSDFPSSTNVSLDGEEPSNSVSLGISFSSRLEMDSSYLLTRKESILDELLNDIRRSCSNSLISTPTSVAAYLSGGENSECVFDCGVGLSEAEMKTLDISELEHLVSTLQADVECESTLLIQLLQVKDKHTLKATKLSKRLTTILGDSAKKNKLCRDLSFTLRPPAAKEDYQLWLNAWKVLARLPISIPHAWRKELWKGLVETSEVSSLDWPSIFLTAFSEYATPRDESLGVQIVKDLHRTGDTGFSSDEEHAILKQLLLAYARFNKSTGYCQGFNILAALILKVVGFDEKLALKVMVHLVDYVLPESYFSQNLHVLSVDMVTFRKLLRHILPELSMHIEALQKEASGMVKKAYSHEDPPDQRSIHAYEPPLTDVFTMQWFLTIFASALPRKTIRCVWDLLLLEGSETLIYTGIAIMAIMEKDLLQAATAVDFYTTMANLGAKLRKSQLLPSVEFMKVIYTVQDSICNSDPSIPSVSQLREKYAYNIRPCAVPEDEEMESLLGNGLPCPIPSKGGSFLLVRPKYNDLQLEKKTHMIKNNRRGDSNLWSRQKSPSLPKKDLTSDSIIDQVKLLCDHYLLTSRQLPTIRCSIDLAPPMARVVCPQTKYGSVTISQRQMDLVYGPDVPDHVIQRGKDLCGLSMLEQLMPHKEISFAISSSSLSMSGVNGVEIGGIENEGRNRGGKGMDIGGKSGVFDNTTQLKGRRYYKNKQRRLIPSAS